MRGIGNSRLLSWGSVWLVVAAWALAAGLVLAYLAFRAEPESGLLLVGAGISAGIGLLRVLLALLQWFDGAEGGVRGYEREAVVLVLLLASLSIRWRVGISVAQSGAIVGWQSPLAWVAVLGLVASLSRRLRRWEARSLALSGLALAAWFLWLTWLTTTPSFSRLHFPFLPLDLVDLGWYLAVAAWVLAMEGAAARRGWEQSGAGSPKQVLPWAVVPGGGLIRLNRTALGRIHLGIAALLVFLLRLTGHTQVQFAYYAANNRLPSAAPRPESFILGALLLILWLWSAAQSLAAARAQARTQKRELPSFEGLGRGRS